MILSIIVPCFNEEDSLKQLHDEINKVLNKINYEIIFINDGSTDNSSNILKDIYNSNKERVKVINFSRNFGKEASIYAGLKYAIGEYTAIIDADMQQDPKYILNAFNFLEKNKEYDVVALIPDKKKFFSNLFYKTINSLSDIKLKNNASDFRIFRSSVRKAILMLQETNRFSKGIFSWIGFNTYYMDYILNERKKGKSKFTFRKKVSYAVDGITAYSVKPLKVAGKIGLFITTISFAYFIYIIIKTLVYGAKTPGFATLACLILFSMGIELTFLGITGEYLSKTFIETKKRPLYIEKSRLGIDEEIL